MGTICFNRIPNPVKTPVWTPSLQVQLLLPLQVETKTVPVSMEFSFSASQSSSDLRAVNTSPHNGPPVQSSEFPVHGDILG